MNLWLISKTLVHFPCNIHLFLLSIVTLKVIQRFPDDNLTLLAIGNTSSLYGITKPHDHPPDFCTTFNCENKIHPQMCCIVLFSAQCTTGGLTITSSICSPIFVREINVPNTMTSKIISILMLKAALSTCKTDLEDLFTE